MDSLLLTSSSTHVAKILTHNKNNVLMSSFRIASLNPKLRSRMIVSAAKKDNKNKKEDRHSFVSLPNEATGPFPESVLLREKKVQEDGKVVPEFADAEEQELFEALTLQLESDLDIETMQHYEVVYLIHEDHKDDVESVNTKVQEFIRENKGRLWRFSDWGMRRLAYKIQKAKNAHYILMNFEIEAKCINDFKTMLDKDDRVIRHLVMKKDSAETQECPPPPEFHTLRGDMVDEDEDEDEEDIDYEEEEYDDDDEEYDDDEENENQTSVGSKDGSQQKMVAR